MAWEHRNHSRYYYRSKRVKGRVVKVYVGHGLVADEAASADLKKQQERKAARALYRALLDDISHVAHPLDEYGRACDAVVKAALLAAGFHQHHGEWRRRSIHHA